MPLPSFHYSLSLNCLSSPQHSHFPSLVFTMGDVEASNSISLKAGVQGKGGFRATMFVYGMIGLDSMGFVANMVSLVLYFMYVMHFDIPTSANTLTNFMGSTFLLSIFGGFISDAYLNRLHTILIFGALEIVALVLIVIQAHSNKLHPQACGAKSSCMEGGIAFMFYLSLSLLALGSGGVRGALPTLGADQFNEKDPEEAKSLASYFNWMTLSTVAGAAVGVTGIVNLSMFHGWWKGFLVSTMASFIGFVILACGKPFYRLRKPGDSPIIRIAQVVVLAFKNRRLPMPKAEELYEINEKGTINISDEKIEHTEQFRFLDRAAILPEGTQPALWTVCTVTQVEEVKILTRMLPILGSTIIMNTCLAQLQTFSVQQGNEMYRKVGKHEFPAPSVPVIPLVFMVILIPMYEFFFVPFARKITGHPSGITQLQRVGVGLVLSAISMSVAGIVEVKRRDQALKGHKIGLFWLSFQYGIFGIADMFTLVGLLEFFYKEAPLSMKSLSTSFTWLSLSFGYFLSTIFVDLINAITKRVTPSKQGWLHGQLLDYNNLNLFYWFLAILSCLNFVIYLFSASWYKYKSNDHTAESNNNKPEVKALQEDGLLHVHAKEGCTESCGVKTTEEESTHENMAKIENGEESTTNIAEAHKSSSFEQPNEAK